MIPVMQKQRNIIQEANLIKKEEELMMLQEEMDG